MTTTSSHLLYELPEELEKQAFEDSTADPTGLNARSFWKITGARCQTANSAYTRCQAERGPSVGGRSLCLTEGQDVLTCTRQTWRDIATHCMPEAEEHQRCIIDKGFTKRCRKTEQPLYRCVQKHLGFDAEREWKVRARMDPDSTEYNPFHQTIHNLFDKLPF
ncbi:ndufa8, NADH-ubiquinone oxidoreductase complex I 19kd subunit [Balamuthia mandrillaris]